MSRPTHLPLGFDAKLASEREILDQASWLEGRSLGEIAEQIGLRQTRLGEASSPSNKGYVGHIYESFFGIAPDSDPRPDFRGAGLELKSTGLRKLKAGGVGPKERLSLRMMGAFDPREVWGSSRIRSKLDHLLVVFYAHQPNVPMARFVTLRVVRWSPNADEAELLRVDWEFIQSAQTGGGRLSESLTKVLASSTKGPGRKPTKSRGYSLKPRFVFSIFQGAVGKLPAASMQTAFGGAGAFEADVAALLHRYAGRTVSSIGLELGLPKSRALSAESHVIRKLLGLPARGRIAEYERFGLTIKTVPISPSGRPWEAMSFPAFDLNDLVDEEWSESDLLGFLTRILIVPLVRPTRDFPRCDATVGRAFFWTPSDLLLEQIRSVWRAYQVAVIDGRLGDYPRRRLRLPIFVNSHGRDSTDHQLLPEGRSEMKRSFWLHPDVVSDAVTGSHPLWRGY